MGRTRRMMQESSPVRRLGLPSERVYFAHPMPDYDTDLERAAVEAIVGHLGPEFDVVNPNHPDHQEAYQAGGRDFSYWTGLAAGCATVVFMALPNDWIGSGVWKEVESAILANRRVFEIDRVDLRLARVVHLDVSRCMSVEETRRWTHVILAYKEKWVG